MAQDIILPGTLDAAFQNFDTRFRRGLKGSAAWWQALATLLTSDTEEEVHSWLQQIPGLAEWITERNGSTVAASEYKLKNRDFNRDVKVPRNKFLDDKLGLYAPIFEQLGMQSAKFADRQIARLMRRGHIDEATSRCWDGKPFYATDHPVDANRAAAGVFGNYLVNTDLTEANFNDVLRRISEFTLEDGEPLGLTPTLLTVPGSMRAKALKVVKASIVEDGGAGVTNINQGALEVRVIPELAGDATDNKSWYVSVADQPIKPFIYQLRQAIVLALVFGPDSEHCKKNKELVYGAEGRAAFGYSFPQLSFKCVAP